MGSIPIAYWLLVGIILFVAIFFQYRIMRNGGSKVKIFFKLLFNVACTIIALMLAGLATGKTVNTEKIDPEKYEVVKKKEYVIFAFPDEYEKRNKKRSYFIWKHAKDTSKVWFEVSTFKPTYGSSFKMSKSLETTKK